MMPRSIAVCLALFVPFVSAPVWADDLDLAQVENGLDLMELLSLRVSTASKVSESLDDAPAIITVVTREEICRWGYQSVAEVLKHTVGFYLIDDQITPNAGVRGMTGGLAAESGAIKVMIDGRSVAYRATSGNWLGIELIPLGAIEQIEIIRGPASALYGADAFLGVVNIITANPSRPRRVQARLVSGRSAGRQNSWGEIVGGTQVGKVDFLLGAAGEYGSHGHLTLPPESLAPTLPPGLGDRRSTDDLHRRSLVLQTRIGYRPNASDRLVLSAYGSGMERGGDLARWAQLSNGDLYGGSAGGTTIALAQLRVSLDGAKRIAPGVDAVVQSTYFQGRLLPSDRIEVGSESFYVKRHESYRGADSMLELRWSPTARFNGVMGAELLYDHEVLPSATRINRITGLETPAVSSRDGDAVDLVNLGVYSSVNYKLFDPWLKITAGARIDKHNHYGMQSTGRLGLTSRLGKSLVAKLLYGSAFKAPSPFLMYATPLRPGDVIGNPRLRPQKIQTLEMQVSWHANQFLSLSSGLAHTWLWDKAEFTPQGINQAATNVASQRALTWESSARQDWHQKLVSYASFELIRSWRELGQEGYAATLVGSQNVVYPKWIARAGVSLAMFSSSRIPLQLGTEAILVGPRRAADATILAAGHDVVYRTYAELDASLSTRKRFSTGGFETRLALRGRNLLGQRGPDPGFSGFEYPLRPLQIFLEWDACY